MPFFLDGPEVLDGRIYFYWDESFDLQGDGLTYDLLVADDHRFRPEDVVHQELGLTDAFFDIEALPTGTYYFRVIARDTKDPGNHWQYPFDSHWAGGTYVEGMRQFTVD